MKIAISNLAWSVNQDRDVCDLLHKLNVSSIEIAPTKVWNEPLAVSEAAVSDYRRFWSDRGIQIVAVQSLLFGKPDLCIFGDAAVRAKTLEYLFGIIRIASLLDAGVLVFGSPKNRRIDGLSQDEVDDIAIPFFRKLGKEARDSNTIFCIEPNPVAYSCNYITTSGEALELIQKVDHPGFRLHLDAAAMTFSEESPENSLPRAKNVLCHFHISEKNLAAVGSGTVKHEIFARSIQQIGFNGFRSLEMVLPSGANVLPQIQASLEFAIRLYFPETGEL